MLSPARSAWCTKKLNSIGTLIQRTTTEAPQGHMYYIGLDVHKKTISYCVKDASGQVHQEGQIGATRWELDGWMKTLPQPWTVAMEATIFTGWIKAALKAFWRRSADLRLPDASPLGSDR